MAFFDERELKINCCFKMQKEVYNFVSRYDIEIETVEFLIPN